MRTKKLTLLYFFLISGLLFSSCNKDNSIKKQETVDSYQVQDSVLIAISQEWIHQSYIVKISKYSNQPEEITVKNLANNELTHSATSSNEAFIIPYQSLKDEYWFFVEAEIRLSGDSIYFEYTYENWDTEPYLGRGIGTKN